MNILDTPIDPADDDSGYTLGGAKTVREFFAKCLIMLWEEGEGFSGKRPFGDSGWENRVLFSIAKYRNVPGEDGAPLVDEDGYFNSIDPDAEEEILDELQAALEEWLYVS